MLFSVTCQVAGIEYRVEAEQGTRAIQVRWGDEITQVVSLDAASDLVGQILGPRLDRARRNSLPWGLMVDASGSQAVYGEWPLLPGPLEPRPTRPSPLSRLRSQWRDEDGPVDALRNALRIVTSFCQSTRRAA